jgi:hypothetical protein
MDSVNRIQVTAVEIVPGQFSSGVQFDVTVRLVFRRKGDTSKSCYEYIQYTQSADTSQHTNRKYSKRSIVKSRLKMLYNFQSSAEFELFPCNKEYS